MLRTIVTATILAMSAACASSQPAPDAPTDSSATDPAEESKTPMPIEEEDVSRVMAPLLADAYLDGVSVAFVTPDGIVTWHGSAEGEPVPNDASRYQIGSVTKVITAIALAQMAADGRVAFDESLTEYFDNTHPAITLKMLATHTSGLPRMPATFAPTSMPDPYAGQDRASLLALFSKLERGPEVYSYSNFGFALLGEALSGQAGKPYPALMQSVVLGPLGMSDSGFSNDVDGMVDGHDDNGVVVPPWSFEAWAPAGALVSDTEDMATFLQANMTAEEGTALHTAQQKHVDRPDGAMGLGWHIGIGDLPDVTWHNGQTGGFHSFVGWNPDVDFGVVILSNTASGLVDKVAIELLTAASNDRPAEPLSELPQRLSQAQRARMSGTYELAPGAFVVVEEAGRGLRATVAGQGPIPLVFVSENELSLGGSPATIWFELPEEGPASAVELRQGEQVSRAERKAKE